MSTSKLGSHSLDMLFLFLLQSALFVISTLSETTGFSFPQFYANSITMRLFGDAQFNTQDESIIMNGNSAATSAGTCALLMYDEESNQNLQIQDSAAGTVAPFSTSFTFKFSTGPQQRELHTNSTDSTDSDFNDAANVTIVCFLIPNLYPLL
jgi:hypothetical protein